MPCIVTGNLILEGVVTVAPVMKAMKRFVDGLHLNTGNLFLSHVFYSCTISFRTFD